MLNLRNTVEKLQGEAFTTTVNYYAEDRKNKIEGIYTLEQVKAHREHLNTILALSESIREQTLILINKNK